MQDSAWRVSELTDAGQCLKCVRVNGCRAVPGECQSKRMQGSAWSVSELTDAGQCLASVRVNGCRAGPGVCQS